MSAKPSSDSELPPALGAGDLHVWLCRPPAAGPSDRFRREVLSRYAPLAPKCWRFVRSDTGKPGLIDTAHPLVFNCSASAGWQTCVVATAVDAPVELGVDIEWRGAPRHVMRLARRFFSSDEVALLAASPPAQRRRRFYDLWTLKEAAIKARGGTLGHDLMTSHFALDYDEAGGRRKGRPYQVAQVTGDEVVGARPHLFLLDAPGQCQLALCYRSRAQLTPRLQLFEQTGSGDLRSCLLHVRAASAAWLAQYERPGF